MDGLTLIVMAAGIGSRYGGLKQVEPVGPSGEWIMDYSVYDALRSGFGRIVLVVRREMASSFRERFERLLSDVCRVDVVVQSLADLPAGFSPPPERVKPWGTGHAVWSCRDVIEGPFGVINADDFYGRGAFELVAAFLAQGGRLDREHALVGYELRNTLSEHGPVTRGVCRSDAYGWLLEIVEREGIALQNGAIRSLGDEGTQVELPSDATVSMNMWAFGRRFVDDVSRCLSEFLMEEEDDLATAEFYLPAAVGRLVADGALQVRVLLTDERWFGVTYRGDVRGMRERLEELTASGVYPTPLWSVAQ